MFKLKILAMKKGFYPTVLFFSFLFCSTTVTFSQELVKPVQNKAQKQAEVRNVPDNQSGSNTSLTTGETNGSIKGAGDPSIEKLEKKDLSNPSNATQDNPNYQEKKANWIKNNPEKYKAVSGNPNLQILTEDELHLLPADQQSVILADEVNYLIIK